MQHVMILKSYSDGALVSSWLLSESLSLRVRSYLLVLAYLASLEQVC